MRIQKVYTEKTSVPRAHLWMFVLKQSAYSLDAACVALSLYSIQNANEVRSFALGCHSVVIVDVVNIYLFRRQLWAAGCLAISSHPLSSLRLPARIGVFVTQSVAALALHTICVTQTKTN